jgi:hypothetical protein
MLVSTGAIGLFSAHVAGGFVPVGAALARSTGEGWLQLLAFPAFIASVVMNSPHRVDWRALAPDK